MLDNEIDTSNITQITLDRLTLAHLFRVFDLKEDYFDPMLDSSFFKIFLSKPGIQLVTSVHLINFCQNQILKGKKKFSLKKSNFGKSLSNARLS